MVLDPRNGPEFDLPAGPHPSETARTWVMASVPRSGSTLLCRTLWDTGGTGAPKEYLNPMQVRDWETRSAPSAWTRWRHSTLRGPAVGLAGRGPWSRSRLEDYVARVRERRTDPTGWFGLKIHHHHFERWFTGRGWPVEEILRPERWVLIRREDRVAQAVSWARALQSGRWASYQPERRPAVYREPQIRRLVEEIRRQELAWNEYFQTTRVEPLRVTYEELVDDLTGTVRAVLRHLDLPAGPEVAVAAPDLARQADTTSADWVRRFRASHPEA